MSLFPAVPYAEPLWSIGVNIATNPKSFFRLENRALVFLGNTSYAIYMLHEIAIRTVLGIQVRMTGTNYQDASSNVVLYAASIVLTLAAASAVYWYYERWFLRRKLDFTVVPNVLTRAAASA